MLVREKYSTRCWLQYEKKDVKWESADMQCPQIVMVQWVWSRSTLRGRSASNRDMRNMEECSRTGRIRANLAKWLAVRTISHLRQQRANHNATVGDVRTGPVGSR
jgi:hypothetical protein